MSSNLTSQQKLDKAYRNLQYASVAFYAMDKEGRRLAAALDSFFIHYDRVKRESEPAKPIDWEF